VRNLRAEAKKQKAIGAFDLQPTQSESKHQSDPGTLKGNVRICEREEDEKRRGEERLISE
jgi:hypothetical protein